MKTEWETENGYESFEKFMVFFCLVIFISKRTGAQ